MNLFALMYPSFSYSFVCKIYDSLSAWTARRWHRPVFDERINVSSGFQDYNCASHSVTWTTIARWMYAMYRHTMTCACILHLNVNLNEPSLVLFNRIQSNPCTSTRTGTRQWLELSGPRTVCNLKSESYWKSDISIAKTTQVALPWGCIDQWLSFNQTVDITGEMETCKHQMPLYAFVTLSIILHCTFCWCRRWMFCAFKLFKNWLCPNLSQIRKCLPNRC